MKEDFPLQGIEKLYLATGTLLSGLLACHTDLHLAMLAFIVMTTLDTFTALHAEARKKGLRFNPFKAYFWREITSEGLRNWARKVFGEYGVYLIIACVIDQWILKRTVLFEIFDRQLTLPVAAVYLFSIIEMWSIGENIEKAGGINIFKRLFQFLPDKIQKLLKKQDDETN